MEKEELSNVWLRLKSDFDILSKKKEEYRQIMNEHKLKSDEASKINSMGNVRQEEYDKQILELKDQHKLRIQFLIEEHDKKMKRLGTKLQSELNSREKVLDGLKDRVRNMEDEDAILSVKIEGLRAEKERYFELERDDKLAREEIFSLQKELELANETLKQKEQNIVFLRQNPDSYE